MSITTVLDRLPEFREAMRLLTQEAVYVGIPQAEDGRKGGPIGNASLGYIQENGSAARNIPARPFLVPGVRKVADQVAEELGAGAAAVLVGRTDAVRTSYNRAGILAVSSVKATITAGEGFAPLSDATLAARARRGVTRTKPLIDTGQLRASVTYTIRKING